MAVALISRRDGLSANGRKQWQADKCIECAEHDHDEADQADSCASFFPIPDLIVLRPGRAAIEGGGKPADSIADGGR